MVRYLVLASLLAGCGPDSREDPFEILNEGPPRRILLNERRPVAEYRLDCEMPGCQLLLHVFAWLEDPKIDEQVEAAGLNLVMLRFTASEGTSKDWLLRRTTNVPDPRCKLVAPMLPAGTATLTLVKSDANALGLEIGASWGPADVPEDDEVGEELPPDFEWSDEGIEQ